jgi:hypothetical protein
MKPGSAAGPEPSFVSVLARGKSAGAANGVVRAPPPRSGMVRCGAAASGASPVNPNVRRSQFTSTLVTNQESRPDAARMLDSG